MVLPPLHLPLISAGFFGGVVQRMLEFVALRIRRSDQGMAPSLSPGLREQTVALHTRLTVLTRAFHRLADLAAQGRLRVYPDRAPPSRGDHARPRPRPACSPPPPASPFGQSSIVAQGPTLPAMPTRGFGWMLEFVPAEYREALARVLANPEMISLIQASPSVARLLRPLCRGLGVEPPEGVFPAPRRRPSRARSSGRPGRSAGAAGQAASTLRLSHQAADARDDRPSKPARAAARRVADAVMSPQARDRWWAARRTAGGAATLAAPATMRADSPPRGRCAKS